MESLIEGGKELRLLIDNVEPITQSFVVRDVEFAGHAEICVIVRRLGHDTGMDTLFDVGSHLRFAVEHTINVLGGLGDGER